MPQSNLHRLQQETEPVLLDLFDLSDMTWSEFDRLTAFIGETLTGDPEAINNKTLGRLLGYRAGFFSKRTSETVHPRTALLMRLVASQVALSRQTSGRKCIDTANRFLADFHKRHNGTDG